MQALHHPTMSAIQPLDTSSGTSGTSGSSSSDASDTSITANDFLTLLVAEMKNQDPTADQDPNAYIDQLVQVNSLQQLIAINQDLSGGSSTATGGSRTATGNAARPARGGSAQLGTAAGTPAAAVASALAPR